MYQRYNESSDKDKKAIKDLISVAKERAKDPLDEFNKGILAGVHDAAEERKLYRK